MAEHIDGHCDDYYCARRDSQGNVRLSCGRGLWIATPDTTITEVQEWLGRATKERFQLQYKATLKFMLEEAQEALAAS